MPFYDYVCPSCGHEETALRKVAERDALWACPQGCTGRLTENGPILPRLMTRVKVAAPSFVLKGGGWAKDGYSG